MASFTSRDTTANHHILINDMELSLNAFPCLKKLNAHPGASDSIPELQRKNVLLPKSQRNGPETKADLTKKGSLLYHLYADDSWIIRSMAWVQILPTYDLGEVMFLLWSFRSLFGATSVAL